MVGGAGNLVGFLGVKDCLSREGKGVGAEANSETEEDYSLVTEMGIGPSRWIGSGYWTDMGVEW